MTEQRLQKIKNEITSLGLNRIQHSAPGSELLAKFYREIYSEDLCTTCPGKLQEAYYQILNLNTFKFITMANSKYSVKNGGIIDTVFNPIKGVPLHVTNDNITDEIAGLLIKSNPNFKNQLVETVGGGSEKSTAAKAGSGDTTRSDEIEATMNKEEIMKALDKLKVEYKTSDTKGDLAIMLAENEK